MRYPDVNKFALDTRIYMYYMVLSNKVVGIEMPRKRQKRAPLSLSLSFYIYLYVYIHLYIFLQRAVCISVLKKKRKERERGGPCWGRRRLSRILTRCPFSIESIYTTAGWTLIGLYTRRGRRRWWKKIRKSDRERESRRARKRAGSTGEIGCEPRPLLFLMGKTRARAEKALTIHMCICVFL